MLGSKCRKLAQSKLARAVRLACHLKEYIEDLPCNYENHPKRKNGSTNDNWDTSFMTILAQPISRSNN